MKSRATFKSQSLRFLRRKKRRKISRMIGSIKQGEKPRGRKRMLKLRVLAGPHNETSGGATVINGLSTTSGPVVTAIIKFFFMFVIIVLYWYSQRRSVRRDSECSVCLFIYLSEWYY